MQIEINTDKLKDLLTKMQQNSAITEHELADYVPVAEQRDAVIGLLVNFLGYATYPDLKLWRKRGYDDRGIGFTAEDQSRLKAMISKKGHIERTWLGECLDEIINAVGTEE